MTDGFRCADCEALLYSPTALASGNCGLHPRKHDFDADDNGDCQECGYPFAFGALHVEPEVPEPAELEAQICGRCFHDSHDGPCRMWIGHGRFAEPCHCRQEAAA